MSNTEAVLKLIWYLILYIFAFIWATFLMFSPILVGLASIKYLVN